MIIQLLAKKCQTRSKHKRCLRSDLETQLVSPSSPGLPGNEEDGTKERTSPVQKIHTCQYLACSYTDPCACVHDVNLFMQGDTVPDVFYIGRVTPCVCLNLTCFSCRPWPQVLSSRSHRPWISVFSCRPVMLASP